MRASEPFPKPVVERLGALVPAQSVGYYEWSLDARARLVVAVEAPAIPLPPDVAAATTELCSTYPLSNLRLSSFPRTYVLSDFVSMRALHRLEYFDCVLRPLGVEHQMRLFLPAPPGTSRVFYFNRSKTDTDFCRRDRDVIEMLRPFLALVRERFEFREARAPANGNDLTKREIEILEWVGTGKTNREIADILVVSPSTVRKHLENVYGKLGVHTRTAAVARVFATLVN